MPHERVQTATRATIATRATSRKTRTAAHEAASQPLVSVCHFGPIYMTDEQLDDYDSSLITGDRFVDQQLSELLHV